MKTRVKDEFSDLAAAQITKVHRAMQAHQTGASVMATYNAQNLRATGFVRWPQPLKADWQA